MYLFLSLRENDFPWMKANFCGFYLVKLKIAFTNTTFWCWISALIHTNHFHNSELVEFKACIAEESISIPLSNLEWYFQKISITYNLGQNCSDKIENLFFSEKNSLAQNQCCLQSFKFLTTKLSQIQDWHQVAKERIWNLKMELFLEFTEFPTFVSTSFLQDCGKTLKQKR